MLLSHLVYLFNSCFVLCRVRNKSKAVAMAKQDSEHSSSRYVCKLKGILEAMSANNLNIDDYPSVLPLPFGTIGSAESFRRRTRTRKDEFDSIIGS